MTYRVEFHAAALAQLNGLPTEAFDALVQRCAGLVSDPWDAWPLRTAEPEFRQTTFDHFGLLSFYVDTSSNTIRIFDVTWAG